MAIAALAGCTDPGDGPDPVETDDGPFADVSPVRGDHVEIQDTAFKPLVLLAEAGQTISWTNHGAMEHTVTPDDPARWGTQGSGSDPAEWLEPGDTWLWTPTVPGEYTYHCIPHATDTSEGWRGMVGKIIVE